MRLCLNAFTLIILAVTLCNSIQLERRIDVRSKTLIHSVYQYSSGNSERLTDSEGIVVHFDIIHIKEADLKFVKYSTSNIFLDSAFLIDANHNVNGIEIGGLFSSIIYGRDYNFDGIPDIDIITRPSVRSGANTIHCLVLASDSGYFQADVNWYNHLYPNAKDKCLYSIGFGGGEDATCYKLIWSSDTLQEVSKSCYWWDSTMSYRSGEFFLPSDSGWYLSRQKDTAVIPKGYLRAHEMNRDL